MSSTQHPPRMHSRQSTASSIAFSDAGINSARRVTYKRPTFPFEHTTRHKPRRWPLAFRFIKGSIHRQITIPVVLHAVFASIVVFMDQHLHLHLGLPSSIIPSLSIVVGLMLVFRNQTSYTRFWDGRMHLNTVITSIRNLTRCFLTTSYSSKSSASQPASNPRQAERADTERTVRYLIALLVATKNHLRGDWGGFSGLSSRSSSPKRRLRVSAKDPSTILPDSSAFLRNRGLGRGRRTKPVPELADLVPRGLVGYEDRGLGVPLQFAALVEAYIKRGFEREWWNAPTSSQHTAQLNTLVDAYGKMETIRLTPVPVALLIHQKQVLALFGAVLPFALVTDMRWWAIPVSALVVFTLYGIDGIAGQLEDPFGTDRADINMDAVVEDIRTEVLVMLDEWQRVGAMEGEVLSPEKLDALQRAGSAAEGVAVEDFETAASTEGLLIDSETTMAQSSAVASVELRKRGEEGGDWFMPQDGTGKSLSWGSVRFVDDDDVA